VAEWEAAVTEFTELTPHLHYGISSWRRASHRATLYGKPWRTVVISTIETFYHRFYHEEADGSKFWGHGISHWVILDAAHRLRMSGTPIGKFRKANCMLLKMNSHEYNMQMASCILSLEPRYKWMPMATSLVNSIEDFHCIQRFLHSSSWLTLQLPPDTFDYVLNIDDDRVADGSNVSGTDHHARSTPVADPYKKGPEFGLLVHNTAMALDAYMLRISGEMGKLRNTMPISDILIRWHRYEETIGKQGSAVLNTLMLQRTMVSHIPFKNPKPFSEIHHMHVTTELVIFTKSSGSVQFYINSEGGIYKRIRERITGVSSAQATTMGKSKPFGPH
jgi:hypothetical protein